MSPRRQAIEIVTRYYRVERRLSPAAAERAALKRVREWPDAHVAKVLSVAAEERAI